MLVFAFAAGCDQTATEDTGDNGETTEDPGDNGEVSEESVLTVGIIEPSGNFNPGYYSSSYDGYVVDLYFKL